MPRLGDVAREEPAEVSSPLRGSAHERSRVHYRLCLELSELCGQHVPPLELGAKPGADRLSGAVAVREGIEQPPLSPGDGRQLPRDGRPPRRRIGLAGVELGHNTSCS